MAGMLQQMTHASHSRLNLEPVGKRSRAQHTTYSSEEPWLGMERVVHLLRCIGFTNSPLLCIIILLRANDPASFAASTSSSLLVENA